MKIAKVEKKLVCHEKGKNNNNNIILIHVYETKRKGRMLEEN